MHADKNTNREWTRMDAKDLAQTNDRSVQRYWCLKTFRVLGAADHLFVSIRVHSRFATSSALICVHLRLFFVGFRRAVASFDKS
jgi:hypothetical protein